MSFYVTLPSNASMNIYPNNEAGHFFVKLPQTIDMTSQYEVGLAEIQFPNTYFNVLEGDVWIRYTPAEDAADSGKAPILHTLRPGLYNSPTGFIDELNRMFMEMSTRAQIRFHYYNNRAACKLYEQGAEVRISEGLRDILRFNSVHLSDANPILQGETPIKIDADLKNVYVYCDLVAARPVGDVLVPLLRTVPILDTRSGTVFRIYDKPHYVPISRFSIDTVEILLTNDKGTTMPFTTGSSVVTLHFRTRKRIELD